MRLEHAKQASRRSVRVCSDQRRRPRQCGTDLGWMMPVVVKHEPAPYLAAKLHPTGNAGKIGKPPQNIRPRQSADPRCRDRCQRVTYLMDARHAQADLPPCFAVHHQCKGRQSPLQLHAVGTHVRRGALCRKCNNTPRAACRQRPRRRAADAGVIRVADRYAVTPRQRRETEKGAKDRGSNPRAPAPR